MSEQDTFEYDRTTVLVNVHCKPVVNDRGVNQVRKAIKKNQKGLLIIAGDTHPFDIISFLPIYAEEQHIPYYFVKSKTMLAKASGNKFTATAVLIAKPEDEKIAKQYDKLVQKARELLDEQDTVIIHE